MSEQQQQQQQQSSSPRLDCFLKYITFKLINEEELKLVIDYICNNLNTNNSNYPYWYDMYSYSIKNRIVLRHRKEKEGDFYPLTELGECVCQNKIINFLKNSDNKCFCNNGYASVFFKKVF